MIEKNNKYLKKGTINLWNFVFIKSNGALWKFRKKPEIIKKSGIWNEYGFIQRIKGKTQCPATTVRIPKPLRASTVSSLFFGYFFWQLFEEMVSSLLRKLSEWWECTLVMLSEVLNKLIPCEKEFISTGCSSVLWGGVHNHQLLAFKLCRKMNYRNLLSIINSFGPFLF